MAHHDHPS